MAWQVTWGPQIPKLREIELATGSTPAALLDEPKLFGYCIEVVNAYNLLASKRTAGLTPNPIQLSEIYAYLHRYGEPLLPVDIFMDLLGVMDLKYLKMSNGNKSTS